MSVKREWKVYTQPPLTEEQQKLLLNFKGVSSISPESYIIDQDAKGWSHYGAPADCKCPHKHPDRNTQK